MSDLTASAVSVKPRLITSPIAAAQVLFGLAIGAIYLPSVIFVFAVMADPEQILFKHHGFISHEALHLASIGRPVAAILANIPLVFTSTIEGFRWTRSLSILTVIGIGCVMIHIMLTRLRMRPAHATIVTLGTFCLPGFIFSIMNLTAWPMHLLSVAYLIAAYFFLVRRDGPVSMLGIGVAFERGDLRAATWALRRLVATRSFWTSRSVCGAMFWFLMGLFTYPPNALMIVMFPVAVLLFSRFSIAYRITLFVRDLIFISAGIVLYILITKFLYFPIGNHFNFLLIEPNTGAGSEYRFVFDFNPYDTLARLLSTIKVAKNLWVLPNFSPLVDFGYLVMALILSFEAMLHWKSTSRSSGAIWSSPWPTRPVLSLASFIVLGIAACYGISVAPIVFAGADVVSYRTLGAPMAVIMLVALFLAESCYRSTARIVLRKRSSKGFGREPRLFFGGVVVLVAWITSYSLCSMIALCQNELSYVSQILELATEKGPGVLIVTDDRPVFYPDKLTLAYDLHGHAIIPYEAGCFSTYCLSAVGIWVVAEKQAGIASNQIDVELFRGPEVDGMTCDMFNSTNSFSAAQFQSSTLKQIDKIREKGFKNTTCVPYQLSWRALDWEPDPAIPTTISRIDNSIWSIFYKGFGRQDRHRIETSEPLPPGV